MKRSARLAGLGALIAALSGAISLPLGAQENARGEALFQLCTACHGVEAGGNQTYLAPAIAGMGEWYLVSQLTKFRSGLRGTHFDDVGGMRMRPMSLTLVTDEDVEAVARYVAALPPTDPPPTLQGGDPVRGRTIYATCMPCHGASGEGNPQVKSGPLARTNDWYLIEQLRKFRAGIRGGPNDPIAVVMRPMALSLPDEQAMKDVLAYIATLSR